MIISVLLVCRGTICTSRCHRVSYLSQQSRQKNGGWDQGTYYLSSSQTGSLNKWSYPSAVSTLCLFLLHHAPSLLCSSSRLTLTDSIVCVSGCVCEIYGGYAFKQEPAINLVTSWQMGKIEVLQHLLRICSSLGSQTTVQTHTATGTKRPNRGYDRSKKCCKSYRTSHS